MSRVGRLISSSGLLFQIDLTGDFHDYVQTAGD